MSRLSVLNKIKQNLQSTHKVEYPGDYPQPRIDNQAWLFAEQIKKVGGFIYSAKEEALALQNLIEKFGELKNIYTYRNSENLSTNFKMSFDMKPHDCHILDILSIKAELAVAENAAIWVREPIDYPRAALFLTQHLIVTVNVKTLVGNMHEAYKKIQGFSEPFGAFIAGPSKTADVEQCLVIGAHGPRSLTVLLEEA